jgi:hypothetical protein
VFTERYILTIPGPVHLNTLYGFRKKIAIISLRSIIECFYNRDGEYLVRGTLRNYTFCPHNAFMWFVWILGNKIAVIFLYGIYRLFL